MPKTFPIMIEVEEIALGSVLRKLHEMPGIAKLHLQLDQGGQGAGRKQLDNHANKGRDILRKAEQAVVRLLANGPKHISEISRVVGGKKTRAYGVMSSLRKQGLTEPGEEHGLHQLTHGARTRLGQVRALPSPDQIKRGEKGRASPGAGNAVLRKALNSGALKPAELKARMTQSGMSPKSVGGIVERAKRDGLIKKNGAGYALTAKGLKIETGAHING